MAKSLRSRVGIGVGALMSLCLMAFSAEAQNADKLESREDTVKIEVSGDIILDYVYRSSELTHYIGGFQIGAGGPPASGSDGETTVEGQAVIRVDATLSNSVSAVVEFGTKGVDGFATVYYGSGGTVSPTAGGSTASAEPPLKAGSNNTQRTTLAY